MFSFLNSLISGGGGGGGEGHCAVEIGFYADISKESRCNSEMKG